MKLKTRVLILTVAAVAVVLAAIYVLTSWVPRAYAPARLSAEMRTAVANSHFPNHVMDFGNATQLNEPFTWTLTQGQLNAYLASADEIADFFSPGPGMKGQVDSVLAEAELTGLAAAMDDGVLTLMARRVGRNQIISVGVSFDHAADGRVKINLKHLRLGLLPVPRKLIASHVEKFAQALPQRTVAMGSADDERAGLFAVSADDLGQLIGQLIKALDGEPIDTVIDWPVGKKTVRIERTEINDGELTLHVQPVR